MKRFPDKFSDNFDDNKRTVSTLVQGTTIKVRNQIAGYITHALTGAEMETPPDEEPDEEGE